MKSLQIDRVILRRVLIPLKEPFRISNGSVAEKESIVIEVISKDGRGFGEASPMSGAFYSSETPASTLDVLTGEFVPLLLSREWQDTLTFVSALNEFVHEPFARAGIEGAVWDHEGRRRNISLRGLFGAPEGRVPSGLAIGIYDSTDELLERSQLLIAKGYQRLKIKIQPGWDHEPLSIIRRNFPNVSLMVDANGSYDFMRDQRTLHGLDKFELTMIEQPFLKDRYQDLASLRSAIRTPICADESAESLDALERLIENQSVDIINIKVQRVGGLLNAKRMHDRAREADLKCWLGTMPELGIASTQALALATLPGFQYPTDVEESDRWFVDDIISPKIEIDAAGFIQEPSNGWQVDRTKLDKYTIETISFAR